MNLKFSLLLLLITFKQVSPQNDQASILNQKITIEAKHETVRAILKQVEKQTHLGFSYDSKVIDSKKKRTVSYKKKTVSEVISLLFDNKVKCKVKGKNIILYMNPAVPSHRSDPQHFSKPPKAGTDTSVRYFIDMIVPNSSGKDSVIRTESIEVPASHFLKIKDDTTILLLKKDSVPK